MNIIAFPVGATNIFPLANSSAGGQLLTEYNLRSRESVDTIPSVKYFIGKSFTHSMDDFAVYSQRDGYDNTISNTTIQIQPGRALVNGHYVELLAPINIDMNDANYLANKEGMQSLKGDIAVGLRMAYSTYQTLAGSALIENEDDYYDGVQVVLLPKDAVKLPQDVPGETEFTKVNMHLLLATFSYKNGAISTVKQNSEKVKCVDADRISNINDILSDTYISKAGLDPNKLYVFAGKSANGRTIDGRDTWCEATDSLMVWDKTPTISTTVPSSSSYFSYNETDGTVSLVLAHKQVDGMVNTGGQSVYFQDKLLPLPGADFDREKGGVVTPRYTQQVKQIKQQVDLIYRIPNGRMRNYIPVLTDRADLPAIPVSRDQKWPYAVSESSLAHSLSELEVRVTAIETKLNNINITIQNEIANYSNSVLSTQWQASIDNINSTIKDIQADIVSLKQFQAAETSEGSSVQAQIDELESKVSTLQSGIIALSDDIVDLQDKWSVFPRQVAQIVSELVPPLVQDEVVPLINAVKTDLQDYIKTQLSMYNVNTTWTWLPGDYVVVGEDMTVGASIDGRYPSTMYVVGPGPVTSIKYVGVVESTLSIAGGTGSDTYQKAYQYMLRNTPVSLHGGVELASYTLADPISNPQTVPSLWDVTQYRGAPEIDYFVARYRTVDEVNQSEHWTCYFYTPNLNQVELDYYEQPLWITGGVPFATESSVGGFVNVPENSYGNGYVRLNEQGYLELVDYELLLTGVLAYQLGEDRSEGAGLSIAEIQSILEEDVNDRVCFPNATQIQNAQESGLDPNVIHLYLTLPETAGTLTIHDIGSRYGASLYVHILGSATSATTVVFKNCDKLRIDSNIEGAPTIVFERVNFYYDAEVLNRVSSIANMTLWYERYNLTDPNLQVDGMTVTLIGRVESSETINPWDSEYANDNHYAYALRSLTFASDGSIINVGLLVSDSTTANIDEGKSVFVSDFTLPQSIGIGYPSTKMTHRIKVTGSFVSHYYVLDENAYMMKSTEFSALTQKYNTLTGANEVGGTISFYTDAQLVSHINGVPATTTVDSWDLNTPHFFTGGVVD